VYMGVVGCGEGAGVVVHAGEVWGGGLGGLCGCIVWGIKSQLVFKLQGS